MRFATLTIVTFAALTVAGCASKDPAIQTDASSQTTRTWTVTAHDEPSGGEGVFRGGFTFSAEGCVAGKNPTCDARLGDKISVSFRNAGTSTPALQHSLHVKLGSVDESVIPLTDQGGSASGSFVVPAGATDGSYFCDVHPTTMAGIVHVK